MKTNDQKIQNKTIAGSQHGAGRCLWSAAPASLTPETRQGEKMEIYNDVNYDYPSCGGYRILQSPNYLTVIRDSNYSGTCDGSYCRLPIDSDSARAIIAAVAADEMDIERLDALDYRGGHVVQ